MGFFKIRQSLAVQGGSVNIGPETVSNLYRSRTARLKTDGGFHVGGTGFIIPAGTVAPTIDADGQMHMYLKGGTPFIAARIGGTPITLAFGTIDQGTPIYRFNVTP